MIQLNQRSSLIFKTTAQYVRGLNALKTLRSTSLYFKIWIYISIETKTLIMLCLVKPSATFSSKIGQSLFSKKMCQ